MVSAVLLSSGPHGVRRIPWSTNLRAAKTRKLIADLAYVGVFWRADRAEETGA
ncbi:hypothetical protein ACVMAJ_005486 [Bradyrhizobium sp. USDA 4448]